LIYEAFGTVSGVRGDAQAFFQSDTGAGRQEDVEIADVLHSVLEHALAKFDNDEVVRVFAVMNDDGKPDLEVSIQPVTDFLK